jgi:hypothetical protein
VADVTERHEVRIRGRDHTIVFSAEDGRLVIRQEPEGGKSRQLDSPAPPRSPGSTVTPGGKRIARR